MNKITENLSEISDIQIIELYWQREESAIKHTDIKYGKFLLRMAYNILHDMQDAEECKDDTYLGVWNAIPPTRPNVFAAFLTQIMRNTATDMYKKRMSKKRVPSALTVSIDELSGELKGARSAEDEYEAAQVAKLISVYLKSLSTRRQFIFIGRYYVADSVEDIAKELSVSVPTVYRELTRIKQGLKVYLERNGVYV